MCRRRLSGALGRLPMSTRLAGALGLLALVVFAMVGVLTVSTMRGYIAHQQDDQLGQEAGQLTPVVRTGAPMPPPPRHWLGSVVVTGQGNPVVQSGSVLSQEELRRLGPALRAASAGTGRPNIRGPLHTPAGDYEAYVGPLGANRFLVLAAPMESSEWTLARLGVVDAVAFTIALAVVVLAGAAILRRGLRPLSTMADTAHTIAATDLSGAEPAVGLRAGGRGGGREVTELRTAFNHMLAHIDSSLAARAAAETRLRTFVADASHELRTPLTSIRGYTDLFQYAAANEPGERAAHLARLRAETARMGALLDDLLLLARLDVQSPYRPAPTDLRELVDEGVACFRAAHPEHPLTTELAASAPVHADAPALRRVLDNLLTNVAAHTPDGTPVHVALAVTGDVPAPPEATNGAEPANGTEPEPADGRADGRADGDRPRPAHDIGTNGRVVRLTVADAGPGIPPESLPKVFDRFYRVDHARSRNRPNGGTGLGLAITEGIVRAHHGRIEVHSVPGDTRFTVTLPGRDGPAE